MGVSLQHGNIISAANNGPFLGVKESREQERRKRSRTNTKTKTRSRRGMFIADGVANPRRTRASPARSSPLQRVGSKKPPPPCRNRPHVRIWRFSCAFQLLRVPGFATEYQCTCLRSGLSDSWRWEIMASYHLDLLRVSGRERVLRRASKFWPHGRCRRILHL